MNGTVRLLISSSIAAARISLRRASFQNTSRRSRGSFEAISSSVISASSRSWRARMRCPRSVSSCARASSARQIQSRWPAARAASSASSYAARARPSSRASAATRPRASASRARWAPVVPRRSDATSISSPRARGLRAGARHREEHALEPRLDPVDAPAHRLVRLGALEAEPLGLLEIARARRVLRLEREQLRLLLRREIRALGGERVERHPGPREPPEVEVEVREVEERLADRRDAAGAPAQVDGGLEVADGRAEVALELRERGEVQAGRRERACVAGLLRGRERLLVDRLRLAEVVVPLEREGERHERDRQDARLSREPREPDRVLQRALRVLVPRGEALREPARRHRLGDDRLGRGAERGGASRPRSAMRR